jgi:hypothetical protein
VIIQAICTDSVGEMPEYGGDFDKGVDTHFQSSICFVSKKWMQLACVVDFVENVA